MTLPSYLINPIKKKAFDTASLPSGIHTVCEEARCPNRGECYSQKTVTFLLLGKICTRNCLFCGVTKGKSGTSFDGELDNILETIKLLSLRYAVLTSVTRDDLTDGGAHAFVQAIQAIREYDPSIYVEVLVPDFQGQTDAVDQVCDAGPYVFNHNLELTPSVFSVYRPMGNFDRSLGLLRHVKKNYPGIKTKTGIMVGLGESRNDVFSLIQNVHNEGITLLTIGQYLKPHKGCADVVRYVEPEEFEEYQDYGKELGLHVIAGPLVRSSYKARLAL